MNQYSITHCCYILCSGKTVTKGVKCVATVNNMCHRGDVLPVMGSNWMRLGSEYVSWWGVSVLKWRQNVLISLWWRQFYIMWQKWINVHSLTKIILVSLHQRISTIFELINSLCHNVSSLSMQGLLSYLLFLTNRDNWDLEFYAIYGIYCLLQNY